MGISNFYLNIESALDLLQKFPIFSIWIIQLELN